MTNLDELLAVAHKLRAPGGCPWDAEQTHESLVKYLLEETYETLEAIDGLTTGHGTAIGGVIVDVTPSPRILIVTPQPPLGDYLGIKEGAEVKTTGKLLSVPVGHGVHHFRFRHGVVIKLGDGIPDEFYYDGKNMAAYAPVEKA